MGMQAQPCTARMDTCIHTTHTCNMRMGTVPTATQATPATRAMLHTMRRGTTIMAIA